MPDDNADQPKLILKVTNARFKGDFDVETIGDHEMQQADNKYLQK
jgi:hypothetical protein